MNAEAAAPVAPPMAARSHLVRTMYNKMLEDRVEQQRDHSCWYEVHTQELPPDLCDRFIQFHEDMETHAFLENSYEKSDWLLTQLYHLVAKSLLSWFMNNTSINGFLKRGSMFVYSKAQFEKLLQISSDWKAQSLLDLGAGDGRVTQIMGSHFEKVYATEASTPMKWRLQELGYVILEIDGWQSQQYDAISCLNLLDRCDKPINVLTEIRDSLRPGTGRAIVAVVLPFRPHVEFSKNGNIPEQYLHIQGNNFEGQVSSFVHDVLNPLGFVVEAFTRLPYLCEGDMEHSFYVLDDAVFVLSVDDEHIKESENKTIS